MTGERVAQPNLVFYFKLPSVDYEMLSSYGCNHHFRLVRESHGFTIRAHGAEDPRAVFCDTDPTALPHLLTTTARYMYRARKQGGPSDNFAQITSDYLIGIDASEFIHLLRTNGYSGRLVEQVESTPDLEGQGSCLVTLLKQAHS